MTDGFLSRWARRKSEARKLAHDQDPDTQGISEGDLEQVVSENKGSTRLSPNSIDGDNLLEMPDSDLALKRTEEQIQVELPTEADLQTIEQGGDLKSFLRPEVSAELKNKAFKTLFGLPEFNVVDGMDVYMANYNEFKPLDSASIAKMTLAKQLLSRPDLEENPAEAENLDEAENLEDAVNLDELPGVEAPIDINAHAHETSTAQAGTDDPPESSTDPASQPIDQVGSADEFPTSSPAK